MNIDNKKSTAKKRKMNPGEASKIEPRKLRKENKNDIISQCVRNLIERDTNIKNMEYDEDSVNQTIKTENELDYEDIDDFLKDFKFQGLKKHETEEKNIRDLPENLKDKAMRNIDWNENIININSFNFENRDTTGTKEEGKGVSDSYESKDFKYWLEIYDYEEKK